MDDNDAVFRILDASLNRATEGLRVCEDYVRFVLNDAHLSRQLKTLRHELQEGARAIPFASRIAARDIAQDVGAAISTPSETLREEAWDCCAASFARTRQAFRSLEEFGKVVSTSWASLCEQLRYRLYAIEQGVSATRRSALRLGKASLCVLVDGKNNPEDFATHCRRLLDAGVDMLQLRDKRLTDRQLIGRAQQLVALVRGEASAAKGSPEQAATTDRDEAPFPLIVVNDRADIARIVGADGVHVGQGDLSVSQARCLVGPHRLVGVSTHCLSQAEAAVQQGADYLGAGPTFASHTKEFDELAGLELLREISTQVALPTFAIGGIGPENIAEVRKAGAVRVAVGASVDGSDDPARAVSALRAGLAAG